MPLHPERILIVRTDRLGDVVLTLPVLSSLRRCFPRARLSVLLRRYTGAIVTGNPYVDEILWYDADGVPVPFTAMLSTLKEKRFDAAVLVRPDPRAAILLFLARIPVRIGTGYRYYSPLMTHRIYEHRSEAKHHRRSAPGLAGRAAGPADRGPSRERRLRGRLASGIVRFRGEAPGRRGPRDHPCHGDRGRGSQGRDSRGRMQEGGQPRRPIERAAAGGRRPHRAAVHRKLHRTTSCGRRGRHPCPRVLPVRPRDGGKALGAVYEEGRRPVPGPRAMPKAGLASEQ